MLNPKASLFQVYFVIDIVLNFRTAFYTKQGSREERPGRIARNYIGWPFFGKTWGWFTIDFVSTLPISYIQYFTPDESSAIDLLDGSFGGERTSSGNTRALKALRLVRLSKMLRLARIKKILHKYSDNVHLQTYISIGFTVFLIFFLVHILACFFYLIGTSDETIGGSNTTVEGWVNAQAA